VDEAVAGWTEHDKIVLGIGTTVGNGNDVMNVEFRNICQASNAAMPRVDEEFVAQRLDNGSAPLRHSYYRPLGPEFPFFCYRHN
jgi:hypothetical protein